MMPPRQPSLCFQLVTLQKSIEGIIGWHLGYLLLHRSTALAFCFWRTKTLRGGVQRFGLIWVASESLFVVFLRILELALPS